MKKYIFIGLGGILGTYLRYFLINLPTVGNNVHFPVNTLFINLLGSFVLAFLLTAALEIWKISESVRLGISVGFLGAFTTFSTLCKEIVNLFYQGEPVTAFSYLFLSAGLGLATTCLGLNLARQMAKRLKRSPKASQKNESGAK